MKRTILFFVLSCFIFQKTLSANTIYAILAYDIHAENISDDIIYNKIKIEKELATISSATKMHLKKITFPQQLTPFSLITAIKRLKPKKNDVVLFFYNGHGYRTKRKGENPWPNITFSGTSIVLDYGEILEKLMKKNAGLVLAFAETCNSYLPEVNGFTLITNFAMNTKVDENRLQGLRVLFRGRKGGYGMTSSKPGQYTWSTRGKGGFYSNAFIKALDTIASCHPDPMWEDVLDLTIQETQSSIQKLMEESFPKLDSEQFFQEPFYHKFK